MQAHLSIRTWPIFRNPSVDTVEMSISFENRFEIFDPPSKSDEFLSENSSQVLSF